MKDLPDWVRKYKAKGMNIIKKKDNYYLYKVHSERKPNKSYPVLITDEYLGVITKNGLIRKKELVNLIVIKEFGLSDYYFKILEKDINDINERISLAILYTYSELTQEAYFYSYLSIEYPNWMLSKDLTSFYDYYSSNKNLILPIHEANTLRNKYKICINNKWYE